MQVPADQRTVLGELVSEAMNCVGAQFGELALHSGPALGLRYRGTLAPITNGRDELALPTDLVMAWMVRYCSPLRLDSDSLDALLAEQGTDHDISELLAVPLIAGGRLLGTLALYNKLPDGGFDEDDIRLLTFTASFASFSIDRLRLMDGLHRAVAERDELASAVGVEVSPVGKEDVEDQCCEALQERFALTPQQARVALMLARRMTNREIAEALFISPNTARRHTSSVLKKLGVSSRHDVAEAIGLE